MVKHPKKPQGITNNPQNSPNLTPKLDSELSKSRQQINRENYQKNKEKRNTQAKARYQQQKLQAELSTQQQLSKYYTAEAFKVLMNLKEYTEINPEKRKNWLNFVWTFKELADSSDIEVKKIAVSDIIQVMKLREEAEKLINDYWDTAKSEEKQKGKSWNSLDQDQKDRLIKYWGYEKARIENNYLTEEERIEKQSQTYLKEIELAKFHEERGKIKCSCYGCEEKKEIQKEIKQKWKKELEDYDQEQGSEKEQCPECKKWVKELDEEAVVCRSCKRKYE